MEPAPAAPPAEVHTNPRSADDVSSLLSPLLHLDRSTSWRLARSVALAFDTYHPQGMTRLDGRFYLSSVEVLEPTVRRDRCVDGFDRSPGTGVGHLFVIDEDGRCAAHVRLGEDDQYHPGGVDTDGTDIWVPVAQYRPDSHSTIYRVNASTLAVSRAFEVADHIGAIAVDPCSDRLHGLSWGSRRLYTWAPDGTQISVRRNRSHFIDYQDCQFLAPHHVVAGGIALLDGPSQGLELGGIALFDARDGRIIHELPIGHRSSAGHTLTRNPMHVEENEGGVRLWVAPDDGHEVAGTELLAFDAILRPSRPAASACT